MSRRASTRATPAEAEVPEGARKRVAIYTRKSTTAGLEQAFNTLDAQRDACERYVAARAHDGWQVLPTAYDDGGFTGANLERPAFRRLLEDVDAGLVDVVVVYKVDRLSRSLLDFTKVMDRLNRAGAAFVSVTQNFSTADAMGRLTLNMLMSFAEFEREMIAERTRDKIAGARRRGAWTGGVAPLGYRHEDKALVVHAAEAAVVREIFAAYEDERSVLEVARLLNARGRPKRVRRRADGTTRPPTPWTKAGVARILRNPIYAGRIYADGDVVEARHEALIDPARWARVQALLDHHQGPVAQRAALQNPAYVLRGLLRCARCGAAMTPSSTRSGAHGKEYRYYRCSGRDKSGASVCRAGSVPAGAIEEYVIAQIRLAVRDGALVRDLRERFAAEAEARRAELAREHGALPEEIARLSAEGAALAEKLPTVAEDARRVLEAELERVGGALSALRQRAAELERATAGLETAVADAEWVARALERFDEVFDMLTARNRARLVRAVVRRVELDEATGHIATHLVDLGAEAGLAGGEG